MGEMCVNKSEAMIWAEGIIDAIKNDPRPYVIHRDGRPVTDLKQMLNSSVELFGDRIAYLQKWKAKGEYESITFNEVLADVNGLGTALVSRGFKDKRIAVIGPNCYQWCSTYLAVTGGVGCIVPLDRELSREELEVQIRRADVSCIFFDKKHEEMFKAIEADESNNLEMLVNYDADEEKDGVFTWRQLIEEGKKLVEEGEKAYLDADIDYEQMCVLMFTSGTTGTPKGVMISHKNLCTELMIAPTIYTLTENDRYMSFLPLHHTYEATCCFLLGIYRGASVGFCQGLKYITKNMQELEPTIMLGVPALYEKLYKTLMKNVKKQGKEKTLQRAIKMNRLARKVGLDFSDKLFKDIKAVFGGKMKTLICGGAKIDPDILTGLCDLGFKAFQGYGLTEAAPLAAFNPENAAIPSSIGIACPTQEFKVIDENEEGIGEICIRGDNLMLGYYDAPEETAKVIDPEGWFHTGDLGYIDEKGYLFITGRAKNVIITKNGKNVYPEEIEYQLSQIDFVEECFVFEGSTTSGDDTLIVAAIKADDEELGAVLGEGYTDEEVKEIIWEAVDQINDSAPAYRKIKKVVLRKKNFIRNTSSKIIRMNEDNKTEE